MLNNYLAEIDQQAQGRMEFLVDQMKQAQGITEQLKVQKVLSRFMRKMVCRPLCE